MVGGIIKDFIIMEAPRYNKLVQIYILAKDRTYNDEAMVNTYLDRTIINGLKRGIDKIWWQSNSCFVTSNNVEIECQKHGVSSSAETFYKTKYNILTMSY